MPAIGEVRTARSLGYAGNDRRIWSACVMCGVARWTVRRRDGTSRSKHCLYCFLKTLSGSNNHSWKGGKFRTREGYIKILSKGHPNPDNAGYVAEHRLVMERELGRYLEKNEDVHHLNGVKDDNRPANLSVLSHGEHKQLTLPYQKRIKELEAIVEKLIGFDTRKEESKTIPE